MIAESLTPIPELENKIGTELTTFALERFARNRGINRRSGEVASTGRIFLSLFL